MNSVQNSDTIFAFRLICSSKGPPGLFGMVGQHPSSSAMVKSFKKEVEKKDHQDERGTFSLSELRAGDDMYNDVQQLRQDEMRVLGMPQQQALGLWGVIATIMAATVRWPAVFLMLRK